MFRSLVAALMSSAVILAVPTLAVAAPIDFEASGTIASSSPNFAQAMVLAPDGSHAYIAEDACPARIVKVRLSDMLAVDDVTLGARSTGECYTSMAAAISPDGAYGYFGSNDGTPSLVKVQLSDMTVVASFRVLGAASANRGGINNLLLSPDGNTAYGLMNNGWIIKVNLVTGAFVSERSVVDELHSWLRGTISPDGQHAYVMSEATIRGVARVIKVRLSDLTIVGQLDLDTATGRITEIRSIAPNGAFLYVGINTTPRQIKKIRLADFTVVDTLTMPVSVTGLTSSAITSDGAVLYVNTDFERTYRITTATMAVGASVSVRDTAFCADPQTCWASPMALGAGDQFLILANDSRMGRFRLANESNGNGGGSGNSDTGSGQSQAAPAVTPTGSAATTAATLRVLRSQLQSGVVRQRLTTSGPGRVEMVVRRGAVNVCRATAAVRKAGTIKISCKVTRRTKPGLLDVRTTFTPEAGAAVVITRNVRLPPPARARR